MHLVISGLCFIFTSLENRKLKVFLYFQGYKMGILVKRWVNPLNASVVLI